MKKILGEGNDEASVSRSTLPPPLMLSSCTICNNGKIGLLANEPALRQSKERRDLLGLDSRGANISDNAFSGNPKADIVLNDFASMATDRKRSSTCSIQ
mmetsp:Transcript_43625/g.113684  ORF Transcript_43625/g.113684 Transcript_43625/m.113684 type:complete len:99 (+) Transcript_43625:2446-2742(+)